MTSIEFTKGHGTLNDFVLLADHDGALELSDREAARLADRRAGIGGDGVIRVVRTAAGPRDFRHLDAEWFMDYRNSDGTVAEMCGNGTRVFAQYLTEHGLVDGDFTIGTRSGLKRIVRTDNGFRTNLGTWRLSREVEAAERGMDSVVQVVGAPDPLPALSLDLGNPHTVVALPPEIDLTGLDLTHAPHVDPHPQNGTNVEFVRALGPGQLSMRVFERGSGETQSCGTGAAAAALATWIWAGSPEAELDWAVDVPGGRLGVHIRGTEVELSGPAVLVASGTVEIA